jgi:hypothetical protein
VVQSETEMKPLLRLAALLSFGCCSAAGLLFLGLGVSSPAKDALPVAAIGLLFLGNAFFVGAVLLIAAEKFNHRQSVTPKAG